MGTGNKFRVRVVKENSSLVAIHYEVHHDDCYGWEDSHKPMRVRKEEIEAAAELLGIKPPTPSPGQGVS